MHVTVAVGDGGGYGVPTPQLPVPLQKISPRKNNTRAGVRITLGNFMKYFNLVPLSLLATAGFSHNAFSQTLAYTLPPIVVTATRNAQTIDDTLASVTVITREEIERTQAKNLQELLTGKPGIDIINNGGRGKNSSLFLRGTNSGHVLVLIDGAKAGSATLGSVSFQHLPVSQIDRIEIVRGPRSSLYGSEAIGGVIQIFTRKGKKGFSANESVTLGRYRSTQITTGASMNNADSTLSVQLGYDETGGFSSQKGNNPDDDGYQNTSLSTTFGHKFSSRVSLDASFLRAETKTEYDSWATTTDYESKGVQQAAIARLKYTPTPEWKMTFGLDQGRDESQEIANGLKTDRFNTIRDRVYLQNDITLNDNLLLVLGFDRQTDTISSNIDYAETSRDNTGVFVQHQWFMQKADILFALRNDNNEAFGNKATGNIAWGYRLNKTMKLLASYGTAFRAPTFNDLYYPVLGNPDLSPEESTSSEIGISGNQHWGNWNLNLYRTDINDLINWACAINCNDTDFTNDIWQPFNIGKVRIRGLEAGITTRIREWTMASTLSLTDPEDTNTGNKLQRRAFRTARIDIDRNTKKFSAGVSIIGQGFRYTDTLNSNRLDSYYLINLRAGYAVSKQWMLRLKLDNALNKDYELIQSYNTAGRSIFATLSYSTP
ncbi:MAG: TonB-dependent receptor [Gammaproteobacteria bacterium]|nr:TonB-dependent receptor [Gammaproteobacteria bacterium]